MKKRNSGFELLRILCMLAIVFYHYVQHGGIENYSTYEINYGLISVQFAGMFGRVACSVFAMISGYYLISARHKGVSLGEACKEEYKRAVPLFVEMHFYYYLILIIFLLAGVRWITFSMIIYSLFPFFFGTWYIVYYLIILAVIPFVRPYIWGLNKNEYKHLLFLTFIIWSVIPTITADEVWTFSNFDFFLVMFLIGGYVRLHVKQLPSRKKRIKMLLVFLSLMLGSVLAFDFAGVVTNQGVFLDKATYFEKLNGVLGLGFSIAVFLLFLDIEFYNEMINRIASCMLGVYLIHNNLIFRYWYFEVLFPNSEYVNRPLLHMFAKVLIVFVLSIIIDVIRENTVGRLAKYLLDKRYDHLWNRLMMFEKKAVLFVEQYFNR